MVRLHCFYLVFFIILTLEVSAQSRGFFGQYQDFLVQNTSVDSSDDFSDDEINEASDMNFVEYNPNFDFTLAGQNLSNFKFRPLDDKTLQSLAKILIDKNLVDALDNSYQELQETCFFLEDDQQEEKDKCIDILGLYDQIFYVIEEGESVDGLENLTGIGQNDFDGEVVTENYVRSSDDNYELLLESERTPNRNSPLEKGYQGQLAVTDSSEIELEESPCDLEDYLKILGEADVDSKLYSTVANQLELSLFDESISQSEKLSAFCVLKQSYDDTGNIEGILRIYLNAPEGENLCQ